MSTFALVHGGGGSAWDWHLVAPELRERGHEPIAVDLPSEDESAGWWDYGDAVVEAVGDRTDLVVYPGQHHGISKPSYQKDRYERYLAWYGQYVKGEAEKKRAGS